MTAANDLPFGRPLRMAGVEFIDENGGGARAFVSVSGLRPIPSTELEHYLQTKHNCSSWKGTDHDCSLHNPHAAAKGSISQAVNRGTQRLGESSHDDRLDVVAQAIAIEQFKFPTRNTGAMRCANSANSMPQRCEDLRNATLRIAWSGSKEIEQTKRA